MLGGLFAGGSMAKARALGAVSAIVDKRACETTAGVETGSIATGQRIAEVNPSD